MRTIVKFLSVTCFAIVLLFVAVSLAFFHLIRGGEFRQFVLNELEAKTALKIQVGEADLEWGRILGIGFREVALFEPDQSQPFVVADRVSARVALVPLLQRRVVLYGVRLHKPAARIVRDGEGRIRLLDRLLNLPFLRPAASRFELDLHSISVQDGEVDLEEEQAQAGKVRTTRFRDVDLELATIRGQQWLNFLQELAYLKQPEPQGAALNFDLKSHVQNENANTTVQARGRVAFPQETFEFDHALWNAQLEFGSLGAGLVRSYFGDQWRVQLLSGVFAPRLHVEGNARDQLRLRGSLSFKKLAVEIPDLLLVPFAPGDGQAEFDIVWQPRRLGISLFDFHSNELNLSMKGETRATAANGTQLQLNLSTAPVPVTVLRKYLPVKTLGSPPLESFVNSVQEGELQLKKLGINGPLGELRNLAQSAVSGLVWFDGELRNVGSKPNADGYLPLQAVQGKIRLERGVFTFADLKGNYGQSHFTDVAGTYQLVSAGLGNLNIHALADVDLAELREQMKLPIFPLAATKYSSSVEELGGRGQLRLSLQRRGESAPDFAGEVILSQARLRWDGIPLTEIQGPVALSPHEIRAEKLTALLSNSPVQIQLSLKNFAAESGRFDLGVESPGVKAGTVSRLLLSTGSPEDPGIVRGSVRYQGSLTNEADRKFTGTLDLVGAKLDHPPLLQPLRELSGRVKIDEAGIDFQDLKGLLSGSAFTFGGRWRYTQNPSLVFDFTAPDMDVEYLLSQIDPESTEWYATLTARGRVSLAQGRLRGFEFTDLKSDLVLDRRVWRLDNAVMRSAGGGVQGVAVIADKPDSVAISLTPEIQDVPLQSMLNWFVAGQTEVTGAVNVNGKLESMGQNGLERKRNLNGALSLRIEDGTIHRLRLLVQILNLLDLSRWFTLKLPDLGKDGIRFRSISGDFKVNQGVFSTQNLIVDSDDLRMTGSGKIDLAKDEIDFVLAVRPFAGIDTVVGYIPLIGRGFAAIKNSFLVASFNVRGPLEEPTITPAPLSTLSEWVFGVLGIPKNIIGWGGDEKKEEPQTSLPEESTKEQTPSTTK